MRRARSWLWAALLAVFVLGLCVGVGLDRLLQRDEPDVVAVAVDRTAHRDVRKAAISSLPDASVPSHRVPQLAALLSDDDIEIRLEALSAFGKMKYRAQPLTDAMGQCLDDPSVRITAINALEQIGPPAQAALPRLCAVVSGPGVGAYERIEALRAISAIGPNGDTKAAILGAATEDVDNIARTNAAGMLIDLDRRFPLSDEELVLLLNSNVGKVALQNALSVVLNRDSIQSPRLMKAIRDLNTAKLPDRERALVIEATKRLK